MSQAMTILVLCDRWRVLCGPVDELQSLVISFETFATVQDRAICLRQWAAEQGVAAGPVVLALGSSDCLSARIELDGMEPGRRPQAMAFGLEEHLPIAAEQSVAAFCEHGDWALGVCTPIDTVRPTVDALEAQGLAVHHIVPAAMLAVADRLERHPGLGLVIVQSEGDTEFDLIELVKGKPTRWTWLTDGPGQIMQRVRGASKVVEGDIGLVRQDDAPNDVWDAVSEEMTCCDHEVPFDQAVARAADRLMAGRGEAWFDLRVEALARPDRLEVYRKPSAVLAVGLVILLLAIIGITQYRGQVYASIHAERSGELIQLFKQVLPEQRVPLNIRTRLQSEARKLAGLSGQGAHGADPKSLQATSALVHMYCLLASLPADLRYRIVDLDVDPDRVRVSGETRSHGDAERITAALRDSGRYDVDPPRTQALADVDGVSFAFIAAPRDHGAGAREGRP